MNQKGLQMLLNLFGRQSKKEDYPSQKLIGYANFKCLNYSKKKKLNLKLISISPELDVVGCSERENHHNEVGGV